MPWGVLSLNVNSGKTWWSTVLLSIAPDCLCHDVLYDSGFLWWNDLNPMRIGKNTLGSWIQGSAGSAGSWTFFSKFWFGKGHLNRTWKVDMNAINYNRNNWCIFLNFGQDLESKKKMVGILANVCLRGTIRTWEAHSRYDITHAGNKMVHSRLKRLA